jgi:hypothetical protein
MFYAKSGTLIMIKLKILSVFLCCMFTIACNEEPKSDENADLYRHKFAKAFNHYNQPKDSLKLRALNYIINNLDDQYHLNSKTLEKYKEILLDGKERSVSDIQSLYDSLSQTGSDFKVYKDADYITDDFLIDNIDQAFIAWQQYPWGKSISFHEFCEFILPYKSAYEKPEYWRKDVAKYYKCIIDSNTNNTNPILAVNQLNKELATWYKVSLTYNSPVDIGFNISRCVKTGSCENSTKMAIYAMKVMGLPVAFDYVPHWANRSGNHNWNALVFKNNVYTFNAAEGSIGSHKVEFIGVGRMKYKRAKVFRKTFAKNSDALYYVNYGEEEIPPLFQNTKFKDVTDQYIPTSDVIIKTDKKTNRFGYLCVFDNQDWVPVYWGEIKSKKVSFNKMGRDVAYLPAIYSGSRISPIADPIILMKNGDVRTLKANPNSKINLSLNRKYPDDETNKIKPGDKYELFYWNNGWVSLGSKVANNTVLEFASAPSNALFWLRDLTEGKQERIFTYENEQQVWW